MAAIEAALKAKLDRYRAEIDREARVETIVLFGSHARGTAGPWSDIDVAVVSPDLANVERAVSVQARARLRVDPAISPIAFTPEQWERAGPASIVAEIRAHGTVVYART